MTEEQRRNLAANLAMFMEVYGYGTMELARICEITPGWMDGIQWAVCDASPETLEILAELFSMKPDELFNNRWEAVLNFWAVLSEPAS